MPVNNVRFNEYGMQQLEKMRRGEPADPKPRGRPVGVPVAPVQQEDSKGILRAISDYKRGSPASPNSRKIAQRIIQKIAGVLEAKDKRISALNAQLADLTVSNERLSVMCDRQSGQILGLSDKNRELETELDRIRAAAQAQPAKWARRWRRIMGCICGSSREGAEK